MESSLFSGWSSGFGVLNTKYSSYTVQPLATLPFRIDNTDRYTETNSNRDLDILTTAPLYSHSHVRAKILEIAKKNVWEMRLGGRTVGNYSIFSPFLYFKVGPSQLSVLHLGRLFANYKCQCRDISFSIIFFFFYSNGQNPISTVISTQTQPKITLSLV